MELESRNFRNGGKASNLPLNKSVQPECALNVGLGKSAVDEAASSVLNTSFVGSKPAQEETLVPVSLPLKDKHAPLPAARHDLKIAGAQVVGSVVMGVASYITTKAGYSTGLSEFFSCASAVFLGAAMAWVFSSFKKRSGLPIP